MTTFKYIIFIFIFIFNFNAAEDYYGNGIGVNVGTVLFTESDVSKKCWTNEQLALVRSRFVFQDLLPDIRVITMADDKFVATLLNYFRLAMEKVKTVTSGKTRQLHLMALSDAIGGYLHHIVIPAANHAFYMGNICFDSVERVEELYNEIKAYLRTDGQTWAHPLTVEQLPKTNIKRKSKRASQCETGKNNTCDNLVFSESGNNSISVPLPFLDSKTNPTTIAVPLKNSPLHNIHSPDSLNILSKYYDTAIACMKSKGVNQKTIDQFNQEYAAYIESEILPHTKEEVFIPAFGGIFLLDDEVKHGGNAAPSTNETEEVTEQDLIPNDETEYYEDDKSTAVMFTAVAIVILIWIITGIIYCCCRMRRKRKRKNKKGRKSISCSSGGSCKQDPSKSKQQSSKGELSPKTTKSKQSRASVKTPPKSPPKSPPKTPPSKKLEKKPSVQTKKNVEIRQCTKCKKCKNHNKSKNSSGEVTPSKQKRSTLCTIGYVLGGPGDPKIKGVKSAPVRAKRGMSPYLSEQAVTGSSTSTEKPIVFGYDFETTTSDSSSFDDTSTYTASGCSTPKKI